MEKILKFNFRVFSNRKSNEILRIEVTLGDLR
jgi:hypothetical protein